jgi:D-sedoheptulose 7-phosphate isomerase
MSYYDAYIGRLQNAFLKVVVTEKDGSVLDTDTGLNRWCDLARQIKAENKTLFFVGNGASAMMASHMAVDSSKNGGLRSLSFNDAALLTAVSNDISYEKTFSLPLQRFANPGDVLITISSSGNSPNIIEAITMADAIGLQVVTLSGMSPQNRSRQLGALNFFVPANTYGLVESCHQALLHCWLDKYMEEEGL